MANDVTIAQNMALPSEIETFLNVFLEDADYDAMADFYLTFRTHMRCAHLLDILRDKWLSSGTLPGLSAHKSKVRIFVALRHWIINYFADDFLLLEDLQKSMTDFLNEMGGFGADEITTEARIGKKLRKTWNRERETYSSLQAEQSSTMRLSRGILGLQSSFQQHNHWNPLFAFGETGTGQECKRSIARSLRVMQRRDCNGRRSIIPASGKAELQFNGSPSPETEQDSHHHSDNCRSSFQQTANESNSRNSIPRKSSEIINDFEGRQRQVRGSIVPLTPQLYPRVTDSDKKAPSPMQSLKRKPRGILKNALHTQPLVANTSSRCRRSSSVSSYGETLSVQPIQWCNLRGSMPMRRQEDQVVEPATDEFLRRLIQMFENESSTSEEDTPSVARQKALDKLEGRETPGKKRKSTTELTRSPRDSTDEDGDDSDHPRTSILGSEKRRRRVGIVPNLNEALVPFASPMILPSENGTQQNPEDVTVVSMVEALGIPNHTSNSLDSGRRLYIEASYKSWILERNTAHVAQALSKIEKAVFAEFDWLELTSGLWINSSAQALSITDWQQVVFQEITGLNLILARFNCAVTWLISELVRTETLEHRMATVTKLIEIAVLCKSYNNFTTIMQIVQALKSPQLKPLRLLSKLPRAIMRQWKSIESLCDKRANWRILGLAQDRAMLNPDAVVVPFMGIYLSRLIVIEQSSEPMVSKLRGTAGVTKLLLCMMGRIYAEGTKFENDVEDDLTRRLVWIGGRIKRHEL